MSITNESSQDEKTEEPETHGLVETPAERRQRHREMYQRDWDRFGAGATRVPEKFRNARMRDIADSQGLVEAVKNRDWIYAHGQVGTGKTHILSALAHRCYINGWRCFFIYVPGFLKELRNGFAAKDGSAPDLIYRAETADLLLIDDIGTEKAGAFASETVTGLVNERYGQEKTVTVFSANYDVDELAERYRRVADRIRERALVVPLDEKRPERT